jgi:O-methyltransferase
MDKLLKSIIKYTKGLVLLSQPHIWLGWLRQPLLLLSNTLSMSLWISKQKKDGILNDYFSLHRDYDKRYKLYEYLIETQKLANEPIDFLEFGVCGGHSFKWWADHATHADSRFYGFDTFEGLPENWGSFYKKGDMAQPVPTSDDTRVAFIKGLFQDTLPTFITSNDMKTRKRKILHLDADLFSSTLFSLSSLAPYLQAGDILMFDEFNVPNHEFFAFKMFVDSYYIKTELIAAVNNYYQIALIVKA